MAKTFEAQISDWVAKCERRQFAVFRESAQRVTTFMQEPVGKGGNMPVDTGFLRRSLVPTLNSPNTAILEKPADYTSSGDWDAGSVALTLARAKPGDTFFAVYTANYARHVNYGARDRAGRLFVQHAAKQWQSIVNDVAQEVKARAG